MALHLIGTKPSTEQMLTQDKIGQNKAWQDKNKDKIYSELYVKRLFPPTDVTRMM